MIEELQPVVSTVVSKMAGLWRQGNSESLIEVSKNTRNEFLTLIDSEISHLPYANDIMQAALSLVTGYMASAIGSLIEIEGINDQQILDQINTRRDPIEALLGTGASVYKFVGTENWGIGLPNPIESANLLVSQIKSVGAEAEGGDRQGEDSFGLGRSTQADIHELANLSVGKSFEVVFAANGNKKTVNMQARLMVSDVDEETMMSILRSGSPLNNMAERKIKVRAGSLHWFYDLILLNDLIDEARKTRIKDKSKFYQHMLRKRSANFLSGLFSLRPSVNNASAILGITSKRAEELALELGDDLDDFATRERLFQSTYAMILFVVDTKWERVTFYHRSLDTFTRVSVDALKRANKNGGVAIEDVLRAYTAGAAPAF